MSITIVVADDHKIVRQGVRALLETEPDFQIVGEAGNGNEAVHLVKDLQPDVLVTDLMMPDINGIEVSSQVSRVSPKTAIVILSMYDNDSFISNALDAGARAYVLKEYGLDELAKAIHEALVGNIYLGPPLSHESIKAYKSRTKTSS